MSCFLRWLATFSDSESEGMNVYMELMEESGHSAHLYSFARSGYC